MKAQSLNSGSMKVSQTSNYRWVIVGILWLVHALAFMNISSLGILAPFIKDDFHLSSFQIGFLISALSIGSSLSQMPAGLITDFAGVRLILTIAVGLIGFILVLFSLAPFYWIALMILLLYGGANGIVGPATSKSVLDWFPSVGRATAMGVKQTGVNFGGIFAGLLLPLMTISLSWRHSLLAVGLVEVASAVLIYRLLKESPARSETPQAPLAWKKILHMAMHRDMLILGGVAFCFMASQFCFSTYLILFLTQKMKYPLVRAGSVVCFIVLDWSRRTRPVEPRQRLFSCWPKEGGPAPDHPDPVFFIAGFGHDLLLPLFFTFALARYFCLRDQWNRLERHLSDNGRRIRGKGIDGAGDRCRLCLWFYGEPDLPSPFRIAGRQDGCLRLCLASTDSLRRDHPRLTELL
jgi:MFS family permease